MPEMRPHVSPFRLGEHEEAGMVRHYPRLRARTKIIAGICLRRELEGISLAISFPFLKREKVLVLFKTKQPNLDNAPISSLVEDATKKAFGHIWSPKEIASPDGEAYYERVRPLEPEEIGEL